MVGIVKEIDGQKKIVPLTTDIGTGAPVGTLISQYKKVPMSGYLYCDGSTFDENDYPALYMYLGTNVLPDYRECVMVGAEQNTTDTIANHDVYGEGEFKDDQLQMHEHNIYVNDTKLPQLPNSTATAGNQLRALGINYPGNDVHIKDIVNARGGDTTHGKQKAVYVYIKATSGLAENQQENVLNDVKNYINNSNSYSTNEVKTGGKWIDGKPIYRKTFIGVTTENGWNAIASLSNLDISKVTKIEQIYEEYAYIQGNYFASDTDRMRCIIRKSDMALIIDDNANREYVVSLEYTKTTD